MFLKLLIITIFFIFLSLSFMGIRILLRKNSRFPEIHISQNDEMQKRGISCAADIDTGCSPSSESEICSSCGKRMF